MSRADGSFGRAVGLFLSGPVIAMLHFLGLYLFAEIACEAGWMQGHIAGVPSLSMVALAVTVAAAAATAVLSGVAYRERSGAHGPLVFTGFLLGVAFTIEIVFVGIPPVFLRPC